MRTLAFTLACFGFGALIGACANAHPIVVGNNLSPEFDRCSFADLDTLTPA